MSDGVVTTDVSPAGDVSSSSLSSFFFVGISKLSTGVHPLFNSCKISSRIFNSLTQNVLSYFSGILLPFAQRPKRFLFSPGKRSWSPMVGNQFRGECNVHKGGNPSLPSSRVKAACTVPLVPGRFLSIIHSGVTLGNRGGQIRPRTLV